MSGSLSPTLRTPREATQVFVQSGFPKQHHAFLVQFVRNGALSNDPSSILSYVVKTVDRPSVQPHVEELNQYNKKRQIYTGYKFNPIKVSFYDSADSSALRMWSDYSKYYFGDFAQSQDSYAYDMTTPAYLDVANTGFGFTASNGGSSDINGQFYFKQINILHFYNGTYDLYTLTNPRISTFDPDELNYSSSETAMINVQLNYEAYFLYVNAPSQGYPAASNIQEFQAGSPFDGDVFDIPGSEVGTTFQSQTGLSDIIGSASSIEDTLNLLRPNAVSDMDEFRYFNDPSGGGLSGYGNFVFGANPSGNALGLDTLATGNSALAIALNLGKGNGELTVPAAVALGATAAGIDGNLYNAVSSTVATVAALSGDRGTAKAAVASGLLASALSGGPVGAYPTYGTLDGTILPSNAYGAINANRPGMAQYGYNIGSRPQYFYDSRPLATINAYDAYVRTTDALNNITGSGGFFGPAGAGSASDFSAVGRATYVPGDTGYIPPQDGPDVYTPGDTGYVAPDDGYTGPTYKDPVTGTVYQGSGPPSYQDPPLDRS